MSITQTTVPAKSGDAAMTNDNSHLTVPPFERPNTPCHPEPGSQSDTGPGPDVPPPKFPEDYPPNVVVIWPTPPSSTVVSDVSCHRATCPCHYKASDTDSEIAGSRQSKVRSPELDEVLKAAHAGYSAREFQEHLIQRRERIALWVASSPSGVPEGHNGQRFGENTSTANDVRRGELAAEKSMVHNLELEDNELKELELPFLEWDYGDLLLRLRRSGREMWRWGLEYLGMQEEGVAGCCAMI